MPIHTIPIPSASNFVLTLEAGRSTVVMGANGTGKTRLGVYLEDQLPPAIVTRVAAHRSLTMSDTLSMISLDRALSGLRYGYAGPGSGPGHRGGHRWQSNPAVALLSDFEFVLQALFAEQAQAAVEHLEAHRGDPTRQPPLTVISRLKSVWERLLPHRKLRFLELEVRVLRPDQEADSAGYKGSQMSDGERVMFYLLGQCLLAAPGSVLIVDEPELHMHKAILGRFWDAIEAERPDCSFVYVTHDLDFVVARPIAEKVVLKSYHDGPFWDLETLPEGSGLPERVVSELVGSRQPVLFVEGVRGGLDPTLYRSIYPKFLIEPIGGCQAVIHAVATFQSNPAFHRLGAVRGCVDADAREQDEIASLTRLGIHVLPVAELENVLLLPRIVAALAASLDFTAVETEERQRALTDSVVREATRDLDAASVRYAVRRLDALLKKLGPSAKTAEELEARFQAGVAAVDVRALASNYRQRLSDAISARNLAGVLSLYDNKGLLDIAAQQLGLKGKNHLAEYVARLLGSARGVPLMAALRAELPSITA